jgi:transcriptional regulator with XRE-family HTH domain
MPVQSEPDAAAAVGDRLRRWRRAASLSLADIAAATDLSPGYISQVERGLANPSLETLKRLADAVGQSVGGLFVEAEDPPRRNDQLWVTRAGERRRITYAGSKLSNELISPDVQHLFEAILVEAEPGSTSGDHPHSHPGEECGFIIQGCMRFWAEDERTDLYAGDSIYLDSTVPHRWVAIGNEDLRAIWVITPPTF